MLKRRVVITSLGIVAPNGQRRLTGAPPLRSAIQTTIVGGL